MNIEFIFQNGIFITLFLSMISFWLENILTTRSSETQFSVERSIEAEVNPGVFLLFFAFILISSQLIYRWFLSGHPPLSNLYESLLFLIWGLLGFFLFISPNSEESKISKNFFVSPQKFVGSILSSTALFIQAFADLRLPSEMRDIKPLIPALQSNWLLMHVSVMILSYAALLIGSLISITYIIINLASWSENGFWSSRVQKPIENKTPPIVENKIFLNQLDSLSYRILAFGFPLLTLGILSGAVWANEAWGSYWSWDPKETWAFITWLIFAFYLHTRLQYGWEGQKSAFVASFGFFIVWICYLGVNLLGKGLHSYGWLS